MNRNKTRKMVALAILIAIQIVLSRFCSVSAWNVKIGFGFVPVVITGILFGPASAALVGAASDFLGAVLFPTGPYFPGFTLTAALTGAVYGLLLCKKQNALRVLGAVTLVQFVLGLFLNTFWISLLYGSDFTSLFRVRIIQAAILAPVEFIVIGILIKPVALVEKRLTA